MLHINLLCHRIKYLAACIYITSVIITISSCANAQVQLPLPGNFNNLTLNGRALEKTFDFEVNEASSPITQNFTLDKTGVILHLKPAPKIKDENTTLKIIDENGTEVQTYKYIDNTLFGLVDPAKTYSIIQHIKPDCTNITNNLNLPSENLICPDYEEFKIYGNIMISSDTSLRIRLQSPSEYYSASVSLPENSSQAENFKFVEIKKNFNTTDTTNNFQNNQENIANLLGIGKGGICIAGSLTTKNPKEITDCLFNNPNINSIFYFKDNFNNKQMQNESTNLVFSYIPRIFEKSGFSYFFKYDESFLTSNPGKEIIDSESSENLSFESYLSSTTLKLGNFNNSKTKINKNSYKLNTPLEVDKNLIKVTFNIPLDNLESIVSPYSDQNKKSVLSNLTISGNDNININKFTISTDNNVLIQNLIEPEEASRNQSIPADEPLNSPLSDLKITTYLKADIYTISTIKTYSSVEQNIAPSVNEKGKPIETINNKSFLQLLITKTFSPTDLSEPNINLDLNSSSLLLKDNSLTEQFTLSGFLAPPDFRPVIEENYRANISLFKTFDIGNNNLITIKYADLRTKDESKLVNFFNIPFIPKGIYKVEILFNGDRELFFEIANVKNKQK